MASDDLPTVVLLMLEVASIGGALHLLQFQFMDYTHERAEGIKGNVGPLQRNFAVGEILPPYSASVRGSEITNGFPRVGENPLSPDRWVRSKRCRNSSKARRAIRNGAVTRLQFGAKVE